MALPYLLQSVMFTLQAPNKYLITIKCLWILNQNSPVPFPWFGWALSVCVCVYICISIQESSTETYTPAQAEKYIYVNVSITFIWKGLSEKPLQARHNAGGRRVKETDPPGAAQELAAGQFSVKCFRPIHWSKPTRLPERLWGAPFERKRSWGTEEKALAWSRTDRDRIWTQDYLTLEPDSWSWEKSQDKTRNAIFPHHWSVLKAKTPRDAQGHGLDEERMIHSLHGILDQWNTWSEDNNDVEKASATVKWKGYKTEGAILLTANH